MRREKPIRGEEKAVSPVISTILLVNIVLAAGVIYFAWAQSSLTQSYSSMQIMYGSNIERSKEALIIEDARYHVDVDFYDLNVTVRNIGMIDLKIVALYFNHTDILLDTDDPLLTDDSYHLVVWDKVTFKFVVSPIMLDVGDIVNIIAVTEKGTHATMLWEVTP